MAHAVYSVCPGISRRRAKELIDAVLQEIVSTLAIGEDVNLRGFGKFAVRQKSEIGPEFVDGDGDDGFWRFARELTGLLRDIA
jgi:hypothetical protein